jgi:hypothetical protein
MALFFGLATYARLQGFKLSTPSSARTRIIKCVFAVIDSEDLQEKECYIAAIDRVREQSLEVITEFSAKRRNTAKARIRILDIAE